MIDLADFIGSTTQIIDYAVRSEKKEFIIGTEIGVLHRLQLLCPEKRFYSLHGAMVCPNMKKTTLASVLDALEKLQHPIELDKQVMGESLRQPEQNA